MLFAINIVPIGSDNNEKYKIPGFSLGHLRFRIEMLDIS